MARTLGILLANVLVGLAVPASAGSVHPDLEARLAALPPGAFVPVIVELAEQGNAGAAIASLPPRARGARGRAVVEALQSVAARTQGPVRAQAAQEAHGGAARKVKPLWVINAIALEATEPAIRRLAARPDVREVRVDVAIRPPRIRRTATDPSAAETAWNIAQVRAAEAWELGFDGAGVVIGSFDTGVDGAHPDLAPRYRGNHATSWFDPYGEHASPFDNNGHGTHTVGTMLGGDLSGYAIGVAPGARWIAAKGWSDGDDATASAFHQIFEWFLAPGGDPANAPDIVNSSWGMEPPPMCANEFRADVQAFRAAGIVPVFASGNSGPDPGSVLAPGSYAESFTVGSTDFDDVISFFSSQGPSPCDGAVKPNLAAPGEFIISTFPGDFYIALDGTSMATPHVSGAAAVLRSIQPALTVEEIESALREGSVDLGPAGPDNAYGAGRLDVAESALVVLAREGRPIVGVRATTATALEAGTVSGVFTVTRRGATDQPLTLSYAVGGTATPGSDYAPLSGTVTIPVGSTTATIVVAPANDPEVELDETVSVTLVAPAGFIVAPTAATVTILSDDLPPDLVVVALDAPLSTGPGLSITVTETTKNQGSAPATASITRLYLSGNATLEATDTPLASRAVPPLAAGAADAGSFAVTIPAGTPPGSYWLIAKADGDDALIETAEGNNTRTKSLSIGPDLVVTTLTVPGDAGAGLAIAVSDTTKNQGGGASAASSVGYYLSTNTTLDGNDVALGTRAIPALAAGASDTASVTLAIPAGTATGSYYLIARADAGDAVAESSETNNTNYRTLRIGPDLVVWNLATPSTAEAGGSILVTDTTKNQGGGSAPATSTRFYFSSNTTLDAGDVLLGARAVPSLAPAATSTASTTLALPPGLAAGTYYVIADADAEAGVAETTETNNRMYRSIQIGADLVVSSLTVPADAGAGSAITATDTTKNQGGGSAPASTVAYYLSTNTTLEAGDVALGSRAVVALAAGATSTGSVTLTIPAGTATGTYYIIARADAGDAIGETSETNNTTSRSLRVGPDLLVSAATTPSTAGAGATISVSDTTKNQGGGAAAGSATRWYLSANSTLDAGDVLLGARAISALDAGVSSTGSTTLTIPAGTATGGFYLIAEADGEGAVAESQEGNNRLARAIQIGADLAISALTVPAAAGAGDAISVSDTTKNQGGGGTPASTTRFFLSADAALGAGDIVLGVRAVPALAAGATSSGTTSLTIPAGTTSGTYYVIARADADDLVAETSETNNVLSRAVRVGPDLVVATFTAPASAAAGGSISVSETTRNTGAASAAASTTTYYLSANSTLDASDLLLGSRVVAALAAGASDIATVTLTIPAGTTTANWYLIAVADSQAAVQETSETNNTSSRTIGVGPDLVVSTLTAPSTATAGSSISVTDTTRNSGAGAAAATTTRFYFSSNPSLDASDPLLGSRVVAALDPSTSASGSVTLTIPAGTAPGWYYVIAEADGEGALAETSETNNRLARSIQVTP